MGRDQTIYLYIQYRMAYQARGLQQKTDIYSYEHNQVLN